MRSLVPSIYAIVVLALIASAGAADLQLIPLKDYTRQPDIKKDPAALGYVADRCSALYGAFARGLEKETDPERQKVRAEMLSAGEKFMGIGVKAMMMGTTVTMADALTRIRNAVVALGDLYIDRIDRVRNLTNNMFSDALIAGDFATCNVLLHQM